MICVQCVTCLTERLVNDNRIAGVCISEDLQPGQYPRVRVVRGHLEPHQVHLAVRHLPAPVLSGSEAGAHAWRGAAPDAEGDRAGPDEVERVAVLGQQHQQRVPHRVRAQLGARAQQRRRRGGRGTGGRSQTCPTGDGDCVESTSRSTRGEIKREKMFVERIVFERGRVDG